MIAADEIRDLAVLAVQDQGIAPLPLGDATTLREGDAVLEVGAPHGLEWTAHEGKIVSVLLENVGTGFLQVGIHVNPGNSGGPLLDSGGRVVGIVSRMRLDTYDRALALPVNYLWSAPARAPMLSRQGPSASADTRWEAYLVEVAIREFKNRDEARQGFATPALIAADQVGPHLMSAQAMKFTVLDKQPQAGPRRYRLIIKLRGSPVCALDAEVDTWAEVNDVGNEQIKASEQLSWLRARGLLDGLYLGTGTVTLNGCEKADRKTVVVELDGSPNQATRSVTLFLD